MKEGTFMCEMKTLNQMPTMSSGFASEEFLNIRDFKEAIAAGLLFLIGAGVSIGGCTLHVRDAMEKRKDEREAKKVSVQEQKVNAPVWKKSGLIMLQR